MKIVIDIEEKQFRDIQRIAEVQFESKFFKTAEQIIAKGTPLPKGHGRLIYAKDVGEYLTLADVPTIIEADRAEKEES